LYKPEFLTRRERADTRAMYPNLKLKLWTAGIKQNQLAKALGMDETMLSKVINGFREPSAQLRTRIACFLETDESWLFERSGVSGERN
jgi:DNA-binding XRE family transcriptional regulator